MRMYDIITKKRDNHELTRDEISFFINGYVKGEIPDYQASALLMAIFIRGMSETETATLTDVMAKSGDVADLSEIEGIKVDKHSTGGVGDKTTLILGPLVAAAGVPVAKMSGRGLGHTGGTIDKLESISGFNTAVSRENFIKNVNKIKIAIAGQTGNLAPADKKIYGLRDVTATVECIPLIASSIMSKKIAGGADAIVLDVKVGSGAFMQTVEDAKKLAQAMVDIGRNVGKQTIAVLSNMNEPLGNSIGNALEVREAVETLRGHGPKDLEELCLTLGSLMLALGKKGDNIEENKKYLKSLLENGRAFDKFKELVEAQGGNVAQIEDISLLPQAENIIPVVATNSGYIASIKTDAIGIASSILGAGRVTKESVIDFAVGIVIDKKVGDFVKAGDVLCHIYANDMTNVEEAKNIIFDSYRIVEEKVQPNKLIIDILK